MIEKIKNKIDELKKDKTSCEKYINSFCESPKAKELFGKNENFNSLKENKETKKIEKEDEYF